MLFAVVCTISNLYDQRIWIAKKTPHGEVGYMYFWLNFVQRNMKVGKPLKDLMMMDD